ncbi:MAG: hypothetical protein HY821_14665 [Acidobacteria bacterium]|nr:hypothetical protein [Acidobacteriota bacterium]
MLHRPSFYSPRSLAGSGLATRANIFEYKGKQSLAGNSVDNVMPDRYAPGKKS